MSISSVQNGDGVRCQKKVSARKSSAIGAELFSWPLALIIIFYSLKDFRQLRLAESLQRNPSKIDDELGLDFAHHLMEIDSGGFFRWAGNIQRLKPVSLSQAQVLYCLLFDRAEVPLEFWTFPAAVAYLQFRSKQAASLDADCLRQWARRLRLTTAKPQVVNRFTPDKGMNFLIDAARRHEFFFPVTKAAQTL